MTATLEWGVGRGLNRRENDTCNIVNTVAAILGWREKDTCIIVNTVAAILGLEGKCHV